MKYRSIVALVISLIHLLLFSGAEAVARTYSTSFLLTENPISEDGNWISGKAVGRDWSDVATTNGMAIGLQPLGSGYADATAILTGTWGPTQALTAVVFAANQADADLYNEVELRLRSSLSDRSCPGYEVLFSLRTNVNVYVAIVRWNGALGDFTVLEQLWGPQYALHNGDEVKATITNSTITGYLNGTPVIQATDNRFASGSPGIGFYRQGGGANSDYGFASFAASDGMDAPVITLQPQSQVVNVGSNATFSVVATGAPPLSYQWYFNTTNIISGATNSELILTNIQDSDAGWYWAWVSNAVGAILSDNAQLVVSHPAVITLQPQSQVVNVGSNATFSVVATGAPPLSYQWYFNTTNIISGATNSELILTNIQDSDAGWYWAWVSNAVGAILSDNAQLVVNHLPVPASPTLERYWNSGFKVRDSLLLGTDPDGDPLALSSVGPSSVQGGTVTNSQGWVYYSPPSGLTNGDAFDYVVADRRGGFATGTVTVVVLTNRGPVLHISLESGDDRSVRLVGDGIANRSYTVEFVNDLRDPNWQTIFSVMSDDSGTFMYLDTLPVGVGNRSYRVASSWTAEAVPRTYSTRFQLTENPISEFGNWISGKSVGLDWADIASTNGIATGLQTGEGAIDHATALLTGIWGSNQTVTATVHVGNRPSTNVSDEVELRLRSLLTAHTNAGYGVVFSLRDDPEAYVRIVRWDGVLDDWILLDARNGSQHILNQADEVKAAVFGDTIVAYINGTNVLEVIDNRYSSGSPGMGFHLQEATGPSSDFGFASFMASDGSTQ